MAITPGQCNMVSDSRLAMWQSLVALAYTDGTLKDGERKMLEDYIQANHLCPEQYALLEKEIGNGVPLKDVYPRITDVRDRANLLNMARVMFYAGGDFSDADRKACDAIHRDQEKAVDFDKVEAAANASIAAYRQQLDKEERVDRSREGRIARLVDYLTGIPDEYEQGAG